MGWLSGVTSINNSAFRNDTTHQGAILNQYALGVYALKKDQTRYQQNNYFLGNVFAAVQLILPKFGNRNTIVTDHMTKSDDQPQQTVRATLASNTNMGGIYGR